MTANEYQRSLRSIIVAFALASNQRRPIWKCLADYSRAQSSRLAEFGGRGMSFASSHQREHDFGYGDEADDERDDGDG